MAGVKILEVVIPGPLTTLQDQGRVGYGQYGVAQSGAVDSFSLRVGNLMVGNPENEACLEMTIMGPVMKALTNMWRLPLRGRICNLGLMTGRSPYGDPLS